MIEVVKLTDNKFNKQMNYRLPMEMTKWKLRLKWVSGDRWIRQTPGLIKDYSGIKENGIGE